MHKKKSRMEADSKKDYFLNKFNSSIHINQERSKTAMNKELTREELIMYLQTFNTKNYADSYFETLSDEELLKLYHEKIGGPLL